LGKRKRRQRYSGPDLTSQLSVAKGDVVELQLGGHTNDGNPVADYEGAPVSVVGGLAGERVKAEIVWTNPQGLHARVTKVLEASPHRVPTPCSYFLDCTGCQWQHVSYDHQLELKRQRVIEAMNEYEVLEGCRVEPVIGSPAQLGYRNHARFTVARWLENRGQVGYMNAVTRRFVKTDRCLLMNDPINDVLVRVQGRLGGMSQFSVRASAETGSTLIQPPLPAGPGLPTSGQTHYEESVAGYRFRVASPSFFQVNVAQLERMADEVRGMLELDGEGTLLDAYCGVGTFAALLAPHVGRVLAIEESASAIQDALRNSDGLDDVEFIQGKSEEVMPELAGEVDYVVLDPPRSGCMPEALDAVRRMQPKRVVLVSCDTEAMARDQSRMIANGFRLEKIQPVDMFPQTRHVEVLSLFSGSPGVHG
jgi:23S rRNA (uracil1939-C5)-methyltransferase